MDDLWTAKYYLKIDSIGVKILDVTAIRLDDNALMIELLDIPVDSQLEKYGCAVFHGDFDSGYCILITENTESVNVKALLEYTEMYLDGEVNKALVQKSIDAIYKFLYC